MINAAWLPVFKKFLATESRSPVHTMLIRSPGGEVNAALDIAECPLGSRIGICVYSASFC